jgi:ferredoxin
MKVTADSSVCCGFANCAEVCPEVFILDEDTAKVRVLRSEPPARVVPAVMRAVNECPTGAISLVDGP